MIQDARKASYRSSNLTGGVVTGVQNFIHLNLLQGMTASEQDIYLRSRKAAARAYAMRSSRKA